MHFGAQSRGLRAPCERFAPWVTPGPRITRFRLAADLGRMGLNTHRVSNKVSKITSRHLVPLDRAFPGTRVDAPDRRAASAASLLRQPDDHADVEGRGPRDQSEARPTESYANQRPFGETSGLLSMRVLPACTPVSTRGVSPPESSRFTRYRSPVKGRSKIRPRWRRNTRAFFEKL